MSMLKRLKDIPKCGDIFIDTNVLIYIHGLLVPSEFAVKYYKQNAYINAVGILLKEKESWLQHGLILWKY